MMRRGLRLPKTEQFFLEENMCENSNGFFLVEYAKNSENSQKGDGDGLVTSPHPCPVSETITEVLKNQPFK